MRSFSRLGFTVALAAALPLAASANVMTFDPLSPDFTDYNPYTENGITLAGSNAASHFHAVGVIGDTSAAFFGTDAGVQKITMAGLFDLNSLDLEFVEPGAVLRATSSNGAVELFSAVGTHVFGAQFKGISFATLDFASLPTNNPDGEIDIDNINTTPVPETGTWMGAAGALALAAARLRRRQA